MKRIVALLMAFAIVLSATPFVFAETTSEDLTTTVSDIEIYCETDYKTVARGQSYEFKVKVSNPSQAAAVITCNLEFEGMKIVMVGDGDDLIDPDTGSINISTNQGAYIFMYVEIAEDAGDEVIAKLTNIMINETPVEDYSLTIPVVEFAAIAEEEYWAYLDEAIDVAAQGNGKVKLLRDVELTETLVVDKGQEIILDLAGFTVSMNHTETVTANHEMIKNNGKLTIRDSSEAQTGALVYTYSGAETDFAVCTVLNECATLIVEGGLIKNASNLSDSNNFAIDSRTNGNGGDASVEILGGSVVCDTFRSLRIYANSDSNSATARIKDATMVGQVWLQSPNANQNKASLTIESGSFEPTGRDGSSVYITTASSKAIALAVSDGTFKTKIGIDNAANVSSFITGGTFAVDPSAYVKDGYTTTDCGDGTYMVTEMSAFAKFMDAVDKAQGGETITLTGDITLDDAGVTITKDLTIDLNGNNITSEGDIFVVTGGTLTVNGTGEITANTDGEGTANAVWANGGNVVINGGTYSVGGDSTSTDPTHQNDLIYTKNEGTVTINGGTFLNNGNVWTLNENDSNRGTITVKGGTFHNWNPADNVSEGEGTNFVAEGYKVTYASGKYTVSAWTNEEEAPNVDTTVSAGTSTGKVEITDNNVTVENVQQAANNTETKSDLADAAFNLQNDASIVGTTTAAQTALTNNNVTIDNNTEITVQVEPYLDVQIKAADTTGVNKTMTVEIDAYYNVVAVATQNNATVGTAILKEKQELTVSEPITITIPLPADFVSSTDETVYIHHYKDNGDRYTYVAKVTGDATNGFYATFVNPNGFSTFEASKSSEPSKASFVGANLTLDSAIDISFFIKKSDLADSGLTAYIVQDRAGENQDNNVTIEQAQWEPQGDFWRIRYADVAAKEMCDKITIVIKDEQGNEVSTVYNDSIRDYALRGIANSADANEVKALKAMLNYGAAVQIFANYNTDNLANAGIQ